MAPHIPGQPQPMQGHRVDIRPGSPSPLHPNLPAGTPHSTQGQVEAWEQSLGLKDHQGYPKPARPSAPAPEIRVVPPSVDSRRSSAESRISFHPERMGMAPLRRPEPPAAPAGSQHGHGLPEHPNLPTQAPSTPLGQVLAWESSLGLKDHQGYPKPGRPAEGPTLPPLAQVAPNRRPEAPRLPSAGFGRGERLDPGRIYGSASLIDAGPDARIPDTRPGSGNLSMMNKVRSFFGMPMKATRGDRMDIA